MNLMNDFKTIELEIKGENGFAVIYFNRPNARNAFNYELVSEFCECLRIISRSPTIKCLIITGKGKVFSVGGDIKEFNIANDPVDYMANLVSKLHEGIGLLKSMSFPIIAAINGACFGAALGYISSCDLRYCKKEATFGAAFTGIGLSPDSSTSFHLPKIVGLSLANEMIFLNRILTSEEAESYGLVNHVIQEENFTSEIRKIASQVAQGPSNAYMLSKILLQNSYSNRLDEHLEEEANYIKKCAGIFDFKEGISAFLKKRQPSFNKN
ncbi:MAG: enoyl-CoA hydratase/isomerase family protein [Promethearchaeota archaeon]|nr:MAG: enoyl-CoA hydratase/isomerase family protein [Candidatus Lokiarchaeota archaeon]